MTISPTVQTTASFSADELARLRDALEQSRRERAEQLARLGDTAPNTDPVAAAHRDSVRRILTDVEAALGRLSAGRYGLCVHCGQAIPFARLEVMPYATGCVRCLSRRDEAW